MHEVTRSLLFEFEFEFESRGSVGSNILSLGVGCSPSNHIFAIFFFFSGTKIPHFFFPNITHSDKCSKTVLLNFLLSTPTVLGTISTPTTV